MNGKRNSKFFRDLFLLMAMLGDGLTFCSQRDRINFETYLDSRNLASKISFLLRDFYVGDAAFSSNFKLSRGMNGAL